MNMFMCACHLVIVTAIGPTPIQTMPEEESGGSLVAAPQSLSVAYNRSAPDHVVVYDYNRGWGGKGIDRITLTRHGQMVRSANQPGAGHESEIPSVTYSNLATQASITVGRDDKIGRAYASLRRDDGKRTYYRWAREERERVIAGERCTDWRANPVSKDDHVAYRACITSDGIVLYDTPLYRSGEEMSPRTAVSIERRPVAIRDVLPPREVLSWTVWAKRASRLTSQPTPFPANHDITQTRNLTKWIDWDGGADRLRQRAADGWLLQESWLKGKRTAFHLRHSSGGFDLRSSEFQLEISFNSNPKPLAWTKDVPLEGKPRKVLGEECRPFNAAPNVSDYWRTECQTKDGLALLVDEDSWGNSAPTLTAISLTRGRTKARDLMPPPDLFNWARWGWPQLTR